MFIPRDVVSLVFECLFLIKISIYDGLMIGYKMQFRTIDFQVLALADLTVKNLELIRNVFNFISQSAEIFIIKLILLNSLHKFLISQEIVDSIF